MLNSPNGPYLFYSLCIAVFILNLIIFLQSGYITVYSIGKWFGLKSKNLVHEDELIEEAQKEDLRRENEAEFRRTMGARAHGESLSSRKSSFYSQQTVSGDSMFSGTSSAKSRFRPGGSEQWQY